MVIHPCSKQRWHIFCLPPLCRHEIGSERALPMATELGLPCLFPSFGASLPESCATRYHELICSRTTHCWPLRKLFTWILAPDHSLSVRCGFSLSVEIDGFASNFLPAVFSGVVQSFVMSSLTFPLTRLSLPSDSCQSSLLWDPVFMKNWPKNSST